MNTAYRKRKKAIRRHQWDFKALLRRERHKNEDAPNDCARLHPDYHIMLFGDTHAQTCPSR